MKLIINADDLGLNHEANAAIIHCFKEGWITNATVMVNMPGFPEACEEIGDFAPQVGLHLNLMEGIPLTPELRKDPFFTNERGEMDKTGIRTRLGRKGTFFLPGSTKQALRAETEAQIQAFLKAGFTQMHVDSHCHSHTIWSLYPVIAPVLKKYGFQTMRKSLNFFGQKRSALLRLYKKLFNRRIRRSFRTADYFSSGQEYLNGSFRGISKNAVCELMVHPVLEGGELINRGGPPYSQIIPFAKDFTLLSYTEFMKD